MPAETSGLKRMATSLVVAWRLHTPTAVVLVMAKSASCQVSFTAILVLVPTPACGCAADGATEDGCESQMLSNLDWPVREQSPQGMACTDGLCTACTTPCVQKQGRDGAPGRNQ